MHPAELAILLHRALEVRLAVFQDLTAPAGWAADPEQLHQVRVAARRLGAVLDLVDPEAYPGHKGRRRALKDLVDLLGLPRELDVHAIWLEARRARTGASGLAPILEHLLEGLDRARAKARRTMERDLDHLRLPDLRKLLEVPSLPSPFQATSLQEAAWACLAPRLDAALGQLPALARHEDPPALHKARVRIKKLRYAVEALEGAFARPPEGVLESLKALQGALGAHHDLAALEALLGAADRDLGARGRAALRSGVLDLLGEVAEARRGAFGHAIALASGQTPAAVAGLLRPALGLPTEEGR